jgi:hypothetical protein
MYEYGESDLAKTIESDYEKYANSLGMPVSPGEM